MAETSPLISLIVASVGRDDVLDRLLKSVIHCHYPSVEVLVIDQNPDDRLKPAIEAAKSMGLEVVWLRSERGLSKARNVGLQHAKGSIVAFPDDDCWYGPMVLATVANNLANQNIDGFCGRCTDEAGTEAGAAHWDAQAGLVEKQNVWRRAISVTLFLKRDIQQKAGYFDEDLGAGAATGWGAGEETDLVLRVLAEGGRIWYDPDFVVFHPAEVQARDDKAAKRAHSYALGIGRVYAKHSFPKGQFVLTVLRSAGGALLSLLKLKPSSARFYAKVMAGKIQGYRTWH